MSSTETDREYRIHFMATAFCAIIGLSAVIGELVCRLNHVEPPSSLNTLIGVCIGALAGAVPGSPVNGKRSHPHT